MSIEQLAANYGGNRRCDAALIRSRRLISLARKLIDSSADWLTRIMRTGEKCAAIFLQLSTFEDLLMPELLITCPNTSKPFETGISIAEGQLTDNNALNCTVSCPHCGGHHPWSTKDAYFAGDPPKPHASQRRTQA